MTSTRGIISIDSTCQTPGPRRQRHRGSPPRPAPFEHPAGFGIERAQLGQHVGKVLPAGPQRLAQPRKIVACDHLEPGKEPRHHRVEPVFLAKLDGKAFPQIARENPHRIAALQLCKHRLDRFDRRAELFGDPRAIGNEVAALVEIVDKAPGDQPLGGVLDDQRRLPGQMIGKRGPCRDILIDVGRIKPGIGGFSLRP